MPENHYFRQPQTQNMLLDILFIWSKRNEDVSYRQGMHEILAPLLWVIERDAIDPESLVEIPSADKAVSQLFDCDYIAHDTYTLFGIIMQHHKQSFAISSAKPAVAAGSRAFKDTESPMVMRSKNIMQVLLMHADPALSTHLESLDIVPQIFLMRWIRLLFGREFSFAQTLLLWDRLFAFDNSLSCVDLICVAMLLRIRWQLLDASYDHALPLLLRYPELADNRSIPMLVEDALYLRDNLNPEAGARLITKHTNRTPPVVQSSARPSTPRVNSRQQTIHQSTPRRTFSPFSTPSRLIQDSGGFDSILQEAARGMYDRGEKWGVNKAVRDAVGEVRKNVQTLQSRAATPGRDAADTVHTNYSTPGPSSQEELLQRINELETRNKALGKMLGSAVSQLWKEHEDTPSKDAKTNAATMAIAKVQLIQVYLEDSTLALTADELALAGHAATAVGAVEAARDDMKSQVPDEPLEIPQRQEELIAIRETGSAKQSHPAQPIFATPASSKATTTIQSSQAAIRPSRPRKVAAQPQAQAPSEIPQAQATPEAPRPSLQSSFSWMLGQPQSDASPLSTTAAQESSRSLFDSPYTTASTSNRPYATSPSVDFARASGTPKRTPARARPSFLFGDPEVEESVSPSVLAANGMGAAVVERVRSSGSQVAGKQGDGEGKSQDESGGEVLKLETIRR